MFFKAKGSDAIQIGDVVRDSITGFEGVAVAITEWLNGCRRVTVQPQHLHNGNPIESQTFDVTQLQLVQAKGHQPQRQTGGPRPEPRRVPDPR